MRRTTKERFQIVIVFVAFFLAIGVAGTYDHAEAVIYNMRHEVYNAIVDKLGIDASMIEIAREYTEHHEYYDSNF